MNKIILVLLALTASVFAALYSIFLFSPQVFVAVVLVLVGGLFALATIGGIRGKDRRP